MAIKEKKQFERGKESQEGTFEDGSPDNYLYANGKKLIVKETVKVQYGKLNNLGLHGFGK